MADIDRPAEARDFRLALEGHPALPWVIGLHEFVSRRAAEIANIFRAGQIRERWFTGELFIQGFHVDGTELFPNAKADLCIPGILVAELKLVGSSHQKKVLRGKGWSLERDLFRLHRSTRSRQELHLGILVAKNEHPREEPLKDNQVGFQPLATYQPPEGLPATELIGFGPQEGAVRVRIWAVIPEPHRYHLGNSEE